MRPPRSSDKLTPGCATQPGTESFRAKFSTRLREDFYRSLSDVLSVSSIGMGTYLGECDDPTDKRYSAAAARALHSGINVFDSAINYRCQRSERALGAGLGGCVADGSAAREEFVVCTKGGYIPLDGAPPATKQDYDAILRKQYFDTGVIAAGEIVAGGHCIAPRFLADQIQRSRRNLGLATIDIYYVHNPEQQLEAVSRDAFREAMRGAFQQLEREVGIGNIGCYGCATWNGLRAGPGDPAHLSLAELVEVAVEAGGPDHHFRVVQLPVNLAMSEAVRVATQRIGTAVVPLLQAAAELGVAVITSAPLMQGQLARGLPAKLREAFPEATSDAQRAVSFVRSLPRVTTALVGMKTLSHLDEQIAAVSR